jgi:hypothetical protein
MEPQAAARGASTGTPKTASTVTRSPVAGIWDCRRPCRKMRSHGDWAQETVERIGRDNSVIRSMTRVSEFESDTPGLLKEMPPSR